MKKKKKGNNYQTDIKKLVLIFTMVMCIIAALITYWIYAYNHKYGKSYYGDDRVISNKVSDYTYMKGNILYLKNIDDDIGTSFVQKQTDFMKSNSVLNIDINKEINSDILSIKLKYTLPNYEEVMTLNVDIRKNQVISDEELLEKVDKNYKSIATDIFNEYIKLPTDSDKVVVDAITDEKISPTDFNQNSEKYIIRIREKLPDIMKLYIEGSNIHYVVRLSEIDKVCYYTNTDSRIINIDKEIGKI